jgi:hypothetical protein
MIKKKAKGKTATKKEEEEEEEGAKKIAKAVMDQAMTGQLAPTKS